MAQFQEQFGVSLSVVREALARLAAEGLVVSEAQRGFRVRPISKADLIDVTRTRIAIEGIAIRWAIDRGDDAWLASVKDAYARLSGIIRATEVEQWLLRFRGVLFEQSERYRYAAIQNVPPTLQSDVDAQHRILVDAVLQRNPEKAQMAIDAHFSSTMKRVLDCLPPDDTEN
jgi:DNA-binding GntR family transcriptional regulator